MQRYQFYYYCILILISLLFTNTYSLILTDLCPNTSCNCILTDYRDLVILCDSTRNLTELPTLANRTLQQNVNQLRLSSSIDGIRGCLVTIPTNISILYPNIASLDLSFNMIKGFLNTTKLAGLGSNLLNIDLSNNFIDDIEMNFFQGNRKLQSINLSQNNLTKMPMIDGETFIYFPSEITNLNFSLNQILNLDLWPLFVKTQKTMIIDMSHNLIEYYTNQIPISLQQSIGTPDPRYFYVNDNRLQRLSDLLLEQYGACSTLTNSESIAYFIVGISNMLLTNNPLVCDCESYNLIKFIQENINDFPQIFNRSALLTEAICRSPASMDGQKYLFSNITELNFCSEYQLPNRSDIFCSIYPNETRPTLTPPNYLSSTTITIQTTVSNGNDTTTKSSTNESDGTKNEMNDTSKSTSPSWYIILGIVLGLILIIVLIVLGVLLCKDRLLSHKCRTLLRTDRQTPNNSFVPIIHSSGLSSHIIFPSNENNRSNHSIDPKYTTSNNFPRWLNKNYPEQETQTSVQIIRSKTLHESLRPPQQNTLLTSPPTHLLSSTHSSPTTTNIIKGIPLAVIQSKSNTDKFEFNVTSISLTPSKRAQFLPQIKSGSYVNSKNQNLLNTSAGILVTNERNRRRNAMLLRKQYQNRMTPSPTRSQSMTTQMSTYNHENFTDDEEEISIPTMESSTDKSSKSVRTLPMLNTAGFPSWIDDDINQQ
ncbi:hypothetical protein I4U23_009130 [Adineta vaga]|nr:hypothetical protein I4U23_009130 [Adineta vaga]